MSLRNSQATIQLRAAPTGEIRSLDLSRADVTLPTMLYMDPQEWTATRKELDPRPSRGIVGSGILVMAASPMGDVLLTARDPWGRRMLPLPIGENTIGFRSMGDLKFTGREPIDPNTGPRWPFDKVDLGDPGEERLPTVRAPCVPVLKMDENQKRWTFVCKSLDCGRCVQFGISYGGWGFLSCLCGDVLI